MTYDTARSPVLLFGGVGPFNLPILSDAWEWEGSRWTDVTPSTSPENRVWPAMAYERARLRTVLVGGAGRDSNIITLKSEWVVIDLS